MQRMDGKNQMSLEKKIEEQAKYWTNLVHYTKPEFYENTVDQRNAWLALKSLMELLNSDEEQVWRAAIRSTIEKALDES